MALAMPGIFLAAMGGNAFAGRVNGYYRKNGTYVSGHYRSNPDGIKSNNYGPSKSSSDRLNPYGRDNDTVLLLFIKWKIRVKERNSFYRNSI